MRRDATFQRITNAALSLILSRGIRKADLAEVANLAGVTRVTVYRYCGDKKGLVRAVCLRLASIFQKAAEDSPADSVHDVELRLQQLGNELAEIPQGDLLARLEEIRRLYPDVYEEFQTIRRGAADRIFQQALAAAAREGSLREGLNLEVLKAIFWAAVVGLLENPSLTASKVSLAEVVATVIEVFRYGIIKSSREGTKHVQP